MPIGSRVKVFIAQTVSELARTFIRRLLSNVLERTSSRVCRLEKPGPEAGFKLFSASVIVLDMRWQFVPGGRC